MKCMMSIWARLAVACIQLSIYVTAHTQAAVAAVLYLATTLYLFACVEVEGFSLLYCACAVSARGGMSL